MADLTLHIGDSCPDFTLPGTDGLLYSLGTLKGSLATLVIFSCNHCPYVQAYEDRIIALAREFQPHGLSVVYINSNDDERYPDDDFESMKDRARKKAFPFPYLHDQSQQVAEDFGAVHTPEVFLFDSTLRLAYHGRIDDHWRDPAKVTRRELHEALTDLLHGRQVATPTTHAIGCTIKWKPGRPTRTSP